MNFNLLRTVITWGIIIVLITIYIIIKKKKRLLSKRFNIIYVSASIISLIIITFLLMIPFENMWKTFDDIESAFSYQHPNGKIIEVYDYEEFSTIFWKDNSQLNITDFKKENNFYKLTNSFSKIKTTPLDIECMLKKHDLSNNQVAIIVTCSKNTDNILITDKKGESLKEEIATRKEYYGVFDKEEYIIYNDKKIYLNKF